MTFYEDAEGGRVESRQPTDTPECQARRRAMVRNQIETRGMNDPIVLEAIGSVPRHLFVPPANLHQAYEDRALSIGEGQTISQPYIVALMTTLLEPSPAMRVLEIGTGSGYQAAVLSRCVGEVDTIENHRNLARQAESRFRALCYGNIRARVGDGFDGWPDRAPYDAILLTAAPERVPRPLLDQLKVGGRLIAPVGVAGAEQSLVVMTRAPGGFATRAIAPVMFVPMTGKAEGGKAGAEV